MAFLETIGFFTLLIIVVRLLVFISPLINPRRIDVKQFGQWALITGSTDGIGKAFAFQLAQRGLNLILISRTKERLDDVSNEIRKMNATIQIKTIPIDFSQDSKIYSTIIDQIKGLQIGVLINNVGMSYHYPEYFDQIENNEEFIEKMIRLNVISVANLTEIILPEMIERHRGLIINVSSIAGRRPTPLVSLYSGTKRFVDLFSRSLSAECLSRGVFVQSLCPGYVVTKLSGIRKSSLISPTPEQFVSSSLNQLTRTMTTGYWSHEIQELISSILPEWISNRLTMSILMGVRRKALKKHQKNE